MLPNVTLIFLKESLNHPYRRQNSEPKTSSANHARCSRSEREDKEECDVDEGELTGKSGWCTGKRKRLSPYSLPNHCQKETKNVA